MGAPLKDSTVTCDPMAISWQLHGTLMTIPYQSTGISMSDIVSHIVLGITMAVPSNHHGSPI